MAYRHTCINTYSSTCTTHEHGKGTYSYVNEVSKLQDQKQLVLSNSDTAENTVSVELLKDPKVKCFLWFIFIKNRTTSSTEFHFCFTVIFQTTLMISSQLTPPTPMGHFRKLPTAVLTTLQFSYNPYSYVGNIYCMILIPTVFRSVGVSYPHSHSSVAWEVSRFTK
jgi:hypothetical protein